MPDQEPVTNITDPRWLRAISHPIRIRLLAMLDEEPASPVVLAAKLGQPLGTIAYHVRTLYDLGLLKLVSTRQRRGATEHYYQTTAHPRGTEESWEALDSVSKQRLLTALLARANDYANRSAAAGGFDAKDAQLNSNSLKLDAKGWAQLTREAKKFLAKAEQIERDAAGRAQADPDSLIDVGVNVMVFNALPFSAELPAGRSSAAAGDATESDRGPLADPGFSLRDPQPVELT